MRGVLLIVVSATALAGCSSMDDKETSEVAAERFHAELNAGLTDDMWDACSEDMRRALGRAGFDKLISGVRAKLGQFKSGQVFAWNLNYGTRGTMVSLRYNTVYERGDAQEHFVYQVGDEGPKLYNYAVNSVVFLDSGEAVDLPSQSPT